LRSLFGKFGIVQTCIVNIDKRHAFIKMISRNDAVHAREGMESYKAGDMQLRVSSYIRLYSSTLTNSNRPGGVLASAPVTAVTTKPASVSSRSNV
jgi:hypothetical protein